MNWARGLFRLWLVLSMLWISAMGITLRPDQALSDYREHVAKAQEVAPKVADLMDLESPTLEQEQNRTVLLAVLRAHDDKAERSKRNLLTFITFSLIPSIAILVTGGGLYWAVRGFRQDRE